MIAQWTRPADRGRLFAPSRGEDAERDEQRGEAEDSE